LQIVLRTFDDLNYRQEQRFHLELGLLKLIHAQRLLPILPLPHRLLRPFLLLAPPVEGARGRLSSKAPPRSPRSSAPCPQSPATLPNFKALLRFPPQPRKLPVTHPPQL
jgi:DNA polymerase III subunit gamma/tau